MQQGNGARQGEHGPDETTDAQIEAALKPLASLRAPAVTQAANRLRLQAHLDRAVRGRLPRPGSWWRRSISVPVPVAAGFVLALCLLALIQLPRDSPPRERISDQTRVSANGEESTAVVRLATEEPEYRETAVYVGQVGFIHREQRQLLIKGG